MSAQIRLCLPTEILLHHVYGADPACVEEETSSCSIMACSRGQRSNRLQIESGRGSEQGGKHSILQHSQEEPSADILRGRVASSEALATSYQSVAELPSASPLATPCPRFSELPSKREENQFRVRT